MKGDCKTGHTYPSAVSDEELFMGCWLVIVVEDIDTAPSVGTRIAEVDGWTNWAAAIIVARRFRMLATCDMGKVQDAAIVGISTVQALGKSHFKRGGHTK